LNNNKGFTIGAMIVAIVLVVGSLIVFSSCIYSVDPGFAGVLVKKTGGGETGVAPQPLSPGYGIRNPFTEMVVEYPVSQKPIILTSRKDEGQSAVDQSITANCSEGMPLSVDVSTAFSVVQAKAPSVYVTYRADIDTIINGFLIQGVRKCVQDQFGQYTVEELYGKKKGEVEGKILAELNKMFEEQGFKWTQFALTEIRVPENVKTAIANKMAMQQEAQKAEMELKKVEQEQKQVVVVAQAKAEAQRLQAITITPQYLRLKELEVQMKMAEKYDGSVPQTVIMGGEKGGGSVNLLLGALGNSTK